jgi:GrpB-like predicted nucleotidyltransferase (UPF0157 family)
MILIHEYQPSWPQEFIPIRAHLIEVLGSLALRVDHIGSTAVPGLGAKDVIDIQVTVKDLTPEIREKLVQAGYQHFEALTEDHLPPGEQDGISAWKKMVFVQPEGQRRTNIHVRIAGSLNQRYALLFRDYLRAHPNSVRSIEVIKRELARRKPEDVDAYYEIKDPVYDLIWDAAKDWAKLTGWQPA